METIKHDKVFTVHIVRQGAKCSGKIIETLPHTIEFYGGEQLWSVKANQVIFHELNLNSVNHHRYYVIADSQGEFFYSEFRNDEFEISNVAELLDAINTSLFEQKRVLTPENLRRLVEQDESNTLNKWLNSYDNEDSLFDTSVLTTPPDTLARSGVRRDKRAAAEENDDKKSSEKEPPSGGGDAGGESSHSTSTEQGGGGAGEATGDGEGTGGAIDIPTPLQPEESGGATVDETTSGGDATGVTEPAATTEDAEHQELPAPEGASTSGEQRGAVPPEKEAEKEADDGDPTPAKKSKTDEKEKEKEPVRFPIETDESKVTVRTKPTIRGRVTGRVIPPHARMATIEEEREEREQKEREEKEREEKERDKGELEDETTIFWPPVSHFSPVFNKVKAAPPPPDEQQPSTSTARPSVLIWPPDLTQRFSTSHSPESTPSPVIRPTPFSLARPVSAPNENETRLLFGTGKENALLEFKSDKENPSLPVFVNRSRATVRRVYISEELRRLLGFEENNMSTDEISVVAKYNITYENLPLHRLVCLNATNLTRNNIFYGKLQPTIAVSVVDEKLNLHLSPTVFHGVDNLRINDIQLDLCFEDGSEPSFLPTGDALIYIELVFQQKNLEC